MSQSGAGLDPQVIPTFEQLRAGSLKYIIYKMSDDYTKIEVDKIGERRTTKRGPKPEDGPEFEPDEPDDAPPKFDSMGNVKKDRYTSFLDELPKDDCRYAIYDLEYTLSVSEKRIKICMINWSPDGAKIKAKMVYASSKEALRRSLTAIAIDIQACDRSEVAVEVLLEKAKQRQ